MKKTTLNKIHYINMDIKELVRKINNIDEEIMRMRKIRSKYIKKQIELKKEVE